MRLWDAKTGQHKDTLTGHTGGVYSVAFSPDGETLASGGGFRDNTVRLWDAKTGQHKDTLTGHTYYVFSVAFSPDGETLASGSDDVRLWDAKTGQHKDTLTGHTGYVFSVAFSPDGETLASGSDDGTVLLWGLTLDDIAVQTVYIPDPNLRAAIEKALDKASGDPITADDMAKLTQLDAPNTNIKDLTGLEYATNLTRLNLGPEVGGNVNSNSVSDLSPLMKLTKLTELHLDYNNISDISPLVANTGLGEGDTVDVRGNRLSDASINTHIPTLQSRGVTVQFDKQVPPTLHKISGDNQRQMPGETLETPFVVEAQDENGSGVAGVPVVFTVIEGSGTLSITSTMTDANGRAESTLTLGPNLGTNTVSVSVTGIEGMVTFNAIADTSTEYLWSIPAGISLIHVPLKVTTVDGVAKTITSIADLYDALGGASTVNFLITYDAQAKEWRGYFGTPDTGTPADRELTDDMGVIAVLRAQVSVHLGGNPLGTNGKSSITLNQGLNVVGLPLRDTRINRVSDLFTLDGIGGNTHAIILTEGREFKLVGRPGDSGDIEITGGQAFILTAIQAATVAISGEPWTNTLGTATAPLLAMKGIQVTDTTPVLGMRGAVVDDGTGLNNPGFRVTVKNISTGRTAAVVTGPDEVDYRLTVVGIETGQAATVGDILEISAHSTNPFIGVQPLRYTVTVEDVKRSLILLPELVAYEIPAETQLLANYPNPFNPETWIPYQLAEDAVVTLTIYDQMGRVVRTLDVGHRVAAVYESRSKAIYWDGRNQVGEQVASGVYFYHLSAGDYSDTRKMIILK